MSLFTPRLDGYYDNEGNWQRTKFCFVSCGDLCTCGPPNGLYYSAAHDKREAEAPSESESIGMMEVEDMRAAQRLSALNWDAMLPAERDEHPANQQRQLPL